MKEILLTRFKSTEKQTLGQGSLYDVNDKGIMLFRTLIQFPVLELPWKDNKPNISCIPEGKYNCKVRYSKKYGRHLHVLDVEGRSFILMHYGNFNWDTKGCILVGEKLKDINGDGLLDVINSRATMERVMMHIKDDENVKLIIKKWGK